MYPSGELQALARRKVHLRGSISYHRWQCRQAAARLAQPLAWIDRVWAQWQRISPFFKMAAMPLGFLLKRSLFPKLGLFSTLLRWAPAAFSAFRAFGANRG